MITIEVITEADDLFGELSTINDAGNEAVLGGVDNRGRHFIAELRGPYAETVAITFGSPWDPEASYHREHIRCDECWAREDSTNGDLLFPIVVLRGNS